jgi:hypothetical protein
LCVTGYTGTIGNLATACIMTFSVQLRKLLYLTILTLVVAEVLGKDFRIETFYLEPTRTIICNVSHTLILRVTRNKFWHECPNKICILQIALISVIIFPLFAQSRAKFICTMSILWVLFCFLWFSVCCTFLAGYLYYVEKNKVISDVLLGRPRVLVLASLPE